MTPAREQAFVVPDTNIFMHYTDWQSYPWTNHAELQDRDVIVVFVKPVIEELDANKESNGSGNVQARCRRLLGWIEANLRDDAPLQIRPGLAVRLDLNFYPDHDRLKNDERILEYAKEQPGDTYVLSNDFTMRLQARHQSLTPLVPSATNRFSDSEEKNRIAELEQQVKDLKHRGPKLSVTPSPSDGPIFFKPTTLPWDVLHFVAHIQGKWKERLKDQTADSHDIGYNSLFPKDRDEFIQIITRLAIKAHHDFNKLLGGSALAMKIRNDGSSAATHLEARIDAPDGVAFINHADAIHLPELPRTPSSRLAIMAFPRTAVAKDSASPKWRIEGNTASFSAGRLAQRTETALPTLRIVSKENEILSGTLIEIELICEEFDLQKLTLNFVPSEASESCSNPLETWQRLVDFFLKNPEKHSSSG